MALKVIQFTGLLEYSYSYTHVIALLEQFKGLFVLLEYIYNICDWVLEKIVSATL